MAMDEPSIIMESMQCLCRRIWLIIKVLQDRVTYNGHFEHLRPSRYLQMIKDFFFLLSSKVIQLQFIYLFIT